MSAPERNVEREFAEAVNMTASELEHWLEGTESRSVGQQDGSGESVGHRSGRRIVGILRTRRDDLSDADRYHMETVVGFVHRHLAQRPTGDVRDTAWRYSLMNWGHDPLR